MKKKSPLIAKALGCVRSVLDRCGVDKNDTVVLACSGGQDSICLLGILCLLKRTYPLNIVVGHVNHGIRQESNDEETKLTALCSDLNIPVEVYRLNLDNLSPGLPNRARDERYKTLANICAKINAKCVLVAHTKTDNIETFLMHIVRGCGINGLEGINEYSEHHGCKIVRPLLDISRDETAEVCNLLNLPFVSDPTNENTDHFRISLRKTIIPLLKIENPNIENVVSSLTDQMSDIKNLLESYRTKKHYFRKISDTEYSFFTDNIRRDPKIAVIDQLRTILGIPNDRVKYSILTSMYEAMLICTIKIFNIASKTVIVDGRNGLIIFK